MNSYTVCTERAPRRHQFHVAPAMWQLNSAVKASLRWLFKTRCERSLDRSKLQATRDKRALSLLSSKQQCRLQKKGHRQRQWPSLKERERASTSRTNTGTSKAGDSCGKRDGAHMGFWVDIDCTLNSNPQPESERAARADVLNLHAQLNSNARLQTSLSSGSPSNCESRSRVFSVP